MTFIWWTWDKYGTVYCFMCWAKSDPFFRNAFNEREKVTAGFATQEGLVWNLRMLCHAAAKPCLLHLAGLPFRLICSAEAATFRTRIGSTLLVQNWLLKACNPLSVSFSAPLEAESQIFASVLWSIETGACHLNLSPLLSLKTDLLASVRMVFFQCELLRQAWELNYSSIDDVSTALSLLVS